MTSNRRYRDESFLEALSTFGPGEVFTSADLAERTRGNRIHLTIQQAGRLLAGYDGVSRVDDAYTARWVRAQVPEVSE